MTIPEGRIDPKELRPDARAAYDRGKAFARMSAHERSTLKQRAPEAFTRLEAASLAASIIDLNVALGETSHAGQFDAMTGSERAALKERNFDLYSVMRRAWLQAKGLPDDNTTGEKDRRESQPSGYEHLTAASRAELKQRDPVAFNRLRSDWIKRGEPTA